LYNKKIAEEKRVAREEAKVVRDREKADKAAATAAKKAAQNTKKTLPTAQSGKRKALRASQPKAKRARRSGGGAAADGSPPPVVAAPLKLNSRGRAINVPAKYRQYKLYNNLIAIALLKNLVIVAISGVTITSSLWWRAWYYGMVSEILCPT
jgi:hypothetical protein